MSFRVFSLLMVTVNMFALGLRDLPYPEYGNLTFSKLIKKNLRQDYGFFKCLTNAPCTLICKGVLNKNYRCDQTTGICLCYSGIISNTGCAVAPSGSKCDESYKDCLYPSVVTDTAIHYLCNTDLATNDAANSPLCVHMKMYRYVSCRDHDICRILCGTNVAQCYQERGICECPAELNNPTCKKASSKAGLCSEYEGRDTDKFLCRYPTPTTADPMQQRRYCLHKVIKPDSCRPLREVCSSNDDCCSNCCEKGICIPTSICPKSEYKALHAETS